MPAPRTLTATASLPRAASGGGTGVLLYSQVHRAQLLQKDGQNKEADVQKDEVLELEAVVAGVTGGRRSERAHREGVGVVLEVRKDHILAWVGAACRGVQPQSLWDSP